MELRSEILENLIQFKLQGKWSSDNPVLARIICFNPFRITDDFKHYIEIDCNNPP